MNNSARLNVARDWFEIDPPDQFGIQRIREPYADGGSIWLVTGNQRCLLVDTGIGVGPLRDFLQNVTSAPIAAFASVGYYDHAGGLHQFDERMIHKNDAWRVQHPDCKNTVLAFYFDQALRAVPHAGFDPATFEMTACTPTRLLEDNDQIDLGDRVFEVLHLPGVTHGACGLFEVETGVLFTGEALVWNATDVYDGEPQDRSSDADRQAFCKSLNRIDRLPTTMIYPGHGERCNPCEMKRVIANYLHHSCANQAGRV